jgi:hypothetical protein
MYLQVFITCNTITIIKKLEVLFLINIRHIQRGKPYFSNTRQNGEWTEIGTRQNEIELAMFGE